VVAADPAAATTTVAGAAGDQTEQDLDGAEPGTAGDCTMTDRTARLGDVSASVTCIQQALVAQGLLSGTASGTFDSATQEAVRKLQTSHEGMFVDGVVGRETALALGVWPDEASLVERTLAPAKGTMDSTGHLLSPVASTGDNAPALPESSGSGRRVVYSRTGQRVWAVNSDGTIIRSWLVSGSKYNNEAPGVHKVYSKSPQSTAWNGKAILPMMIRYQKTSIGAIGFHGIPVHVSDGTVYQTDAELGSRLSGGCQRQNNLDAKFLWDWADVGTTVVVV
jgi:lipoprotein-anchoring transpeptidase ErfK/SrfK